MGPGREHGAPHRRVDRAAGRIEQHEPEEEQRVALEVVGQVLRRALHPQRRHRLRVVGRRRGRRRCGPCRWSPRAGTSSPGRSGRGRPSPRGRRRAGTASSACCRRSGPGWRRRGSRPGRRRGSGRAAPGAWPGSCKGLRRCPRRDPRRPGARTRRDPWQGVPGVNSRGVLVPPSPVGGTTGFKSLKLRGGAAHSRRRKESRSREGLRGRSNEPPLPAAAQIAVTLAAWSPF